MGRGRTGQAYPQDRTGVPPDRIRVPPPREKAIDATPRAVHLLPLLRRTFLFVIVLTFLKYNFRL